MSKQLLTVFSIVCLATQALADCQDITLDSCVGDPPFQTLKLASEENCQQYCSQVFPDVCTFFIYDRQQDICQLFDYDPQAYADSCALIAATPTPSLAECRASDEECLVRLSHQYSNPHICLSTILCTHVGVYIHHTNR